MSSKKHEVLPHQSMPTSEGYMQTAIELCRDRLFSLEASTRKKETLLERLNQLDDENRNKANGLG